MIRRLAVLLVLALLASLSPGRAGADELRPGYLDVRALATDTFAVVWRVPAMADRRLAVYARLPPACRTKSQPSRTIESAFYTERWVASCPGGLRGSTLAADGLSTSATDVLVRIAHLDGVVQVGRLTSAAPQLVVAGTPGPLGTASTYFELGVEHILTGFDHLLFVLALVVLIRDRWTLIKTITAFTLAHSLTLAAASLGYLTLPQQAVEACIALSIVFVACEIVKSEPGQRRLSERAPWLVAFSFGLLHGLGFAGALKEVGLPQHDLPLALLAFNLGVEAGQLVFVGAVLIAIGCAGFVARRSAGILAPVCGEGRLRRAAGYAIGITSSVWLVERLFSFA